MGGLPGIAEPVQPPSQPQSQPPHSYQDFVSQSAGSTEPAYTIPYDTSVNESALPFETAPPAGGQVETVKIRKIREGIMTHDNTLNTDTKALLEFFLAHCDAPQMSVNIHGTHLELRTRMVAEGNNWRTESYTETVTDFETDLPVSAYIQPKGTIYNSPDRKGNILPIPELLQQYVDSNNKLKTITLRKHVVWDYDELSLAIKAAVKSTGYSGFVDVSFPKKNWNVTVASNSALSKMSEDNCTRVLCVLSCLWIIFLPIYCMSRKKMDNTLRADFTIGISEQDWFNQNYVNIVANVERFWGGGFKLN